MQNRNKWLALVAVCLGFFMGLLDVTVVNVALPTIQTSFNSSFSQLQWIINAYTLIFAAVLFLISKLGDLIGRKKVFIASLAIFSIFSLACTMAPNIWTLIVFRGIQGIGGAGMLSLSMSIIADIFTGKQRGLALGIWGSIAGLSTALGPLIGGILLSFFSWKSIFLVNLPIGIVALLMSVKFIPKSKTFDSGKIDWAGMLLSFTFMFLIILGLIQKETNYQYSWFNWQVSSLIIVGIVLIIIFAIVEARSKAPMLDLALLKNHKVVGSFVACLALGMAIYAFFSYIIILSQNYMGYSALQSGTQLMIISAFSLVLGPLSGSIAEKVNPNYIVPFVLLLAGIGTLTLPLMLKDNSDWVVMIPMFVTLGIANSLVNPYTSNISVSSVEPRSIGMTSGLLQIGKQFGTSLGVVILGLAMTSTYDHQIAHAHLTNKLTAIFQSAGPFSGSDIANQMHVTKLSVVIHDAFIHGMNSAAVTSGIIFLITAVICYWLLCRPTKE